MLTPLVLSSNYAKVDAFDFRICSLNMRGFTSRLSMLQDLTCSHIIIAVPEHWLNSNNINELGRINDNFSYHGMSTMNDRLSQSQHTSRPFGGVAFLRNNRLPTATQIVNCENRVRA